MSWSAPFKAAMRAASREPVWIVSTRPVYGDPPVSVSSSRWPGCDAGLLVDQCSVSWGSLQWPSLQVSGSSATIAIARGAVSMAGLRLGTVVAISMAVGSTVEQVYVGVLRNATQSADGPMVWQLQGLEVSLWGRYEGSTSASRRLFRGVGAVGAIAGISGYGAGDPTCDHTSMTLHAGTSGYYCLRVTPNSGEKFYLLGTADSGTQMTGCLTGGGGLDSDLGDADVGNDVEVVAFDAPAHPLELLDAALDPDNDDWPDEWRMDLPAGVYDADRTESEKLAHGLGATAPATVQVATVQEVDRFIDWLSPILAPIGMALVQRQGMISGAVIRGHYDLDGETVTDADVIGAQMAVQHWASWPASESITITDRTSQPGMPLTPSDITEVGDTAGDPWATLAYAHHLLGLDPPNPPAALSATASTTTAYAGHGQPVTAEHIRRCPLYGGSPGALSSSANRAAWRTDIGARLLGWITLGAEVVTVTLPGWRHEAIGDAIRVQSSVLTHRTGDALDAYGLVIGGGPDLFGTTSTYTLLVIPPY